MDIHIESKGKLLHNLLYFGRLAKALGIHVTPNGMREVAQALETIDLGNKADFYYTLRALMVHHKRDLPLFDKAFSAFWRVPNELQPILNPPPPQAWDTERKTQFLPPLEAEADSEMNPDELTRMIAITPIFSAIEVLRYKNFADMSPEELAAAKDFIQQLSWSLGKRKTRRFKAGKGQSIDIRRAFRQNMRFAGEILLLPRRKRQIKPRPFVVLCDISGSMERYTRLFLHFVHSLASSIYQVESFVFSTKLLRISRQMRRSSADAALKEIGYTVNIWGSGTRTDAALRTFNYRWARRLLGRGAVVLLITDGWDRGNAKDLQREMARLYRSCHRLIWLNPLLGDANYAPLTQGAQAMLPHVDDFLPIHNLASLERLAKELMNLDWQRSGKSAFSHFIVK
jgi:uncharacterized protein with von Willebrand factor type A (vWA) domain